MSAPASEKQAKGKSKRATIAKSHKLTKGGKEATINDDKFRGHGTSFKCKLVGVAEVDGPRGDSMCIEAIKKLKQHIKQTGEHKPKIILNVTLMGIRILEEKTKNVLFEHPVNKVSFITHDPDDKKIFSFISSARCSSGHVGHMMYAIKYDKVAGIITTTLYELFQTVYRLRQEAAQKQRQAQATPQTPDNISQASTAVVSNGPSQASSIDDTNIYEEPSSTSTLSTIVSANSDTSHYQSPTPRPLPPAPYKSQGNLVNQESKENAVDTIPDQASNTPASDQFFSSSVFSQPDPSASDNVSLSSVDLMRKESISSSISSSSETASYDAKSLDLKSGVASSTPPSIPRTRPVSSNSSGQAVDVVKPKVPEEEDPDYETIPSCQDYETIPTDLVKKTVDKTETKPGFAGFSFKESFKDDNESLQVSKKVDPFGSPEKPEPKSAKSEESPPSSAVFSNDDFFSSHFDDKSAHAPTTDFPADDPFAPTLNNISEGSKANVPFASNDAFESAFGSGQMSPVAFDQEKENGAKIEGDISCSNKAIEKGAQKGEAFSSSSAFEAAFGSSEPSSPAIKPSETNVGESPDREKPASEEPLSELSWSNAFGEGNSKKSKDEMSAAEPSWSAAFEDNDSKDKLKGDESTFAWDASFGTKFDSEESDQGQQPDKVATEPDLSWTNAFSDKPKQEVTFSWDDAFGGETKDGQTDNGFGGKSFDDAFGGQTDSKDGQTDNGFGGKSFNDAFGGQTDSKDRGMENGFGGISFNEAFGGQTDNKGGQTDNAFSVSSFNDAFASTPLRTSDAKKDDIVKGTDHVFTGNFGAILTPIKADTSEKETEDKPDVSQDGKGSAEDKTSEGKIDSKKGFPESDRKAKLAEDEDLSSSDKENDNEKSSEGKIETSRKIPQIIEPTEKDDSDDDDDDDDAVRPVTLPVLPTKPKTDLESPSVPPPLPPRPMAPLPSLPPRPRTYSSPVTGEIPQTPPRPAGSVASPPSKAGTPKRLPPALPPRIDLEMGKARASSASVGSTSTAVSDPFGSSKSTENDISWQISWSKETNKQEERDSMNSKNSPDPFGDEFFTDFNFSGAKMATNETNSTTTQNKNNFFSDPFVSKEGEEDMFKADFGGVDPFADFSSNNTNIDPFALDGGDVFSGFSTNKDPFGDSEDPFADKGTVNDPFTLSPKKDDNGGTFQLSKNSADGDFADSFA